MGKIYASDMTDKGLVSKYVNNLKDKQTKMGRRRFPRRHTNANRHMKR